MTNYFRGEQIEGFDAIAPQVWHIDRSVYKRDYCRMIENRKSALSHGLLPLLSTPQAIALTDEYVAASTRILVMGQETGANYSSLEATTEYTSWSSSIGEYISFDFAYDSRVAKSKFWQAFDEVASAFDLPNRRSLAWSNVLKVQLLEPINGSYSVGRLPSVSRMEVVKWQHLTVLSELDFISPDAIVFMTGNLSWVLRETLGATFTDQHGFKSVTIPSISIPMVQIAHPNARYDTSNDRGAALSYLKEEIKRLSPAISDEIHALREVE